jgi:predicted DNA-binding transcriptional regulator YafY
MYHPTTRALAVLELLQTHRRMSGSELAQRLGVDRRTLRRYISALEELGIPIAAERGRHGAYMLVAGYKLPPMLFSPDEALALAVGLVAARSLGLSEAAIAVESAQAKLERVMPLQMKRRVRSLGETVALDLARAGASASNEALLAMSEAAQLRQRVHLRYRSAQGDDSARDFDAYGLAFRGGSWFAVGWCHLRKDLRSFRLDRVLEVRGLDSQFVRPKDFDAIGYLAASISALPRAILVELLLDTDLATARQHVHTSLGVLEAGDGGVLLRSHEDDLAWYARQLARLPFAFVVQQPRELRGELRKHAEHLRRVAGSAAPRAHGKQAPQRVSRSQT